MKFEIEGNIFVSPFELSEGMRLRTWAFAGLTGYLSACVSGAGEGSHHVICYMGDGDIFYIYRAINQPLCTAIQVISDGYVSILCRDVDFQKAMKFVSDTIYIDNEERVED